MGAALLEKPQARNAEPGRSQFYTDFNFTRTIVGEGDAAKAAQAKLPPEAQASVSPGDLVLEGYANTWVMDRDFEFVLRSAFDKSLPLYLAKNPIVLWQHNHDWPLGQVATGYTDETGLHVVAYIRKPTKDEERWKHTAFNDIKAGIVRTFSIGGWFTREFVEGEIFVTEIDLFEISVVSVPSNPDSIFEASVKNLKGLPMRTAASKPVSQLAQLLGMEPVSDPALITLDDQGRRQHYHRLAADLSAITGRDVPSLDAWRDWNKRLDGAAPEEYGELAAEAEQIVGALYGNPQAEATAKAGRVLSKANERALRGAAEKIREAAEGIGSVLDQLPPQED